MNRLCPTSITCPGPQPGLNADSPIINFSSEYTDGPDFFAPIFPYWNPFDPQLPAWWRSNSCLGIPVFSTVSQADADLEAQRLAVLCSNNPPPDAYVFPPLPTLCQTILATMQQYQTVGDTINFNIWKNLYLTTCLGEQPPTTPYDVHSCDQLSAIIQALSGSDNATDRQNAALAQAVYNTKCTTPTSRRRPLFYNAPYSFSGLCADGFGGGVVNVPAGTFVANTQILTDRLAALYAQDIVLSSIICPSALASEACANEEFSATITVNGQPAPFVVTLVSGNLPTGMTLIQTDGRHAVVSGVCNVPGNYTFSVQFQSSLGISVVRSYTINVLGIANLTSIPQPQQGTPYAFTLLASGGTAPYTFEVNSGMLPPGLAMDANGNITGTPTAAGTFNFTVLISDSSP